MPSKSKPETKSLSLFPTLVTVQELGKPAPAFVEQVEKPPFGKSHANSITNEDLTELAFMRPLVKQIHESLMEHSATFGSQIERFEITQTCANRAEVCENHHFNTHPNCYLSGISYVAGDPLGPKRRYSISFNAIPRGKFGSRKRRTFVEF